MSPRKHKHPGGLFNHPGRLLSFTALVLVVGWIAFVGNLHLHEVILGAVVVALCTVACAQIYNSSTLSIEVRTKDLVQLWRVPTSILKDCAILTGVLLRDLFSGVRAGSFYRACRFPSSRRDPILVGRSALAVAYATISPNMIVLGIDPGQDLMLFHQIQRDAVSKMTRKLGAQA